MGVGILDSSQDFLGYNALGIETEILFGFQKDCSEKPDSLRFAMSNAQITQILAFKIFGTIIVINSATMSYELKKIKVLGITTDFNQCDCCGRKDLKKTVAILDLEMGVTVHFGTTCAYMANKYDTAEAFAEAKGQIKKAENNYREDMKNARMMAWRILAKLYGTTGDIRTGLKTNCSVDIFEDCASKAFQHITNSETKGTMFQYEK